MGENGMKVTAAEFNWYFFIHRIDACFAFVEVGETTIVD
jgi:hypothetical protein